VRVSLSIDVLTTLSTAIDESIQHLYRFTLRLIQMDRRGDTVTRWRGDSYELRITNYELRITNYFNRTRYQALHYCC